MSPSPARSFPAARAMRFPRGAGLRRPVLAGAFVGCAYAALTAHRDHLATSHDANPFVPARGAASGGDSSWDTRAFAAERDALERETRTQPEKNSAARVVIVPEDDERGPRGNGNDDDDARAKDLNLLAEDEDDERGALDLRYPDPFATFRGCVPQPRLPGLAPPRPLDRIAASVAGSEDDSTWPVDCDGHESLCATLRAVASDSREVLAAVANSQAPGIHEFIESIVALKIPNFVVVTLDDALDAAVRAKGVASYRSAFGESARGSHKVSAQKFGIVREFVERGCSVLLTDTDVIYLQNPFPFLYRDSDVESMSDGWDAESAHGFFDVVDDPAMGAGGRRRASTFRVSALNSGTWFVAATKASARLMAIMQHRMATEPDLWDQAGYNLELWFPSRDEHATAGAAVRVMDPLCFVNSKTMFRFIRHRDELDKARHVPVAMHSNYHTDKAFKMQRVRAYYLGDASATKEQTLGVRCTVGCDANLRSTRELEAKVKHGVNDGVVGSKKWVEGARGVWAGAATATARKGGGGPGDPGHCRPPEPWLGKVEFEGELVDRAGHAFERDASRSIDACVRRAGWFRGEDRESSPKDSRDASAAANVDVILEGLARRVCSTLASSALDPGAPEVYVVALAGGADAESESEASDASDAFASFAARSLARLELQRATLVVAGSALAAETAKHAGLANVVDVAPTLEALLEGSGAGSGSGSGSGSSSSTRRSAASRTYFAALKWFAIRTLLRSGVSAVATDFRATFLSNPSEGRFAKDADVEALSDGWDDTTAYGYDHVVDDPAMDWSRFVHGGRIATLDPGFARLRATREAANVASLVARRMLFHAAGDRANHQEETPETTGSGGGTEEDVSRLEHALFNEAVFLPSHGAYASPGATKRALNYLCFANSKTLFRFARRDRKWREPKEHAPVVVRLSYHANEPARLDDVHAYYLEGNANALDGWSDGERSSGSGGKEEKRTDACAEAPGGALRRATPAQEDAHPLGRHFRLHRTWSWGGVTPLSFDPGGGLRTPWGEGEWGFVPSAAKARRGEKEAAAKFDDDRVFANFVGATHVLQFEDEGEGEDAKPFGMFVSERCHDGDMVVGRMVEENA